MDNTAVGRQLQNTIGEEVANKPTIVATCTNSLRALEGTAEHSSWCRAKHTMKGCEGESASTGHAHSPDDGTAHQNQRTSNRTAIDVNVHGKRAETAGVKETVTVPSPRSETAHGKSCHIETAAGGTCARATTLDPRSSFWPSESRAVNVKTVGLPSSVRTGPDKVQRNGSASTCSLSTDDSTRTENTTRVTKRWKVCRQT